MSKKKVLDSGYVHIDNGGMNFKFVEVLNTRERDILHPDPNVKEESEPGHASMRKVIGKETTVNRNYYAEVSTSHYGSGTKFRYPLGNPHIVGYLINCLQRVKSSMEKSREEPTDGYEFAFRESNYVRISMKDGKKTDGYWPSENKPECGDGECSSDDAKSSSSDRLKPETDIRVLFQKSKVISGVRLVEHTRQSTSFPTFVLEDDEAITGYSKPKRVIVRETGYTIDTVVPVLSNMIAACINDHVCEDSKKATSKNDLSIARLKNRILDTKHIVCHPDSVGVIHDILHGVKLIPIVVDPDISRDHILLIHGGPLGEIFEFRSDKTSSVCKVGVVLESGNTSLLYR